MGHSASRANKVATVGHVATLPGASLVSLQFLLYGVLRVWYHTLVDSCAPSTNCPSYSNASLASIPLLCPITRDSGVSEAWVHQAHWQGLQKQQ